MSARGWSAFRHRDFRLFCAARFAMTLAVQMQNVAVAWLVYDVSEDALALGLVGLASFLPTASLVLVTGLIADRYDRRRILVLSLAAMAVVALGLLAHVRAGVPTLWPRRRPFSRRRSASRQGLCSTPRCARAGSPRPGNP
jgi:MFS family permease